MCLMLNGVQNYVLLFIICYIYNGILLNQMPLAVTFL